MRSPFGIPLPMLSLAALAVAGCGTGIEDDPGAVAFWVFIVILIAVLIPFIIQYERAAEEAERVEEERARLFEQQRGEEDAKLDRIRDMFDAKSSEPLQNELMELANRLSQATYAGERKRVAEEVYRLTLGALRASPDLSVAALALGRLAYGIGRAEDKPSVYDESAIMNDIAVHR